MTTMLLRNFEIEMLTMFGNRSVNGLVRSGTHECVLNSFAIPAVKLLTLFPSSFVNFVLIRWKRRSQMISWTHCAFPSPFCSHCGIQIVYHVFFCRPLCTSRVWKLQHNHGTVRKDIMPDMGSNVDIWKSWHPWLCEERCGQSSQHSPRGFWQR